MTMRLDAPWGTRIDRDRPVSFSFEGRLYTGFAGDCIASALAANDQWLLSRSFKYHRPRGVLTMAGQDANTLVQLEEEPNVRADLRPIEQGMAVTAQNVTGSLERDRSALLDRLGRFLPVGFYYRSFFGPGHRSWLKLWEPIIRKAAGLGTISLEPMPVAYRKANLHCDVLVVGAGAAGLSAALMASEAGASVVIVEQGKETGGALTYARFDAEGTSRADRQLDTLRDDLDQRDTVHVMTGATCNGWFADNWLPVIKDETFYRVRAREVVIATGSHEQPLVFRNNDLPGIMVSSAAQRLMRHYGVRPGRRAVVYAGHGDGALAALDLIDAGVAVEAILAPAGHPMDTPPIDAVAARGVRILTDATVIEATGGAGNRHIRSVRVSHAGSEAMLPCDLLVTAAGYTPGYQLPLHAGVRLTHDERTQSFALTELPAHMHLAGAVGGHFDLDAVMASGRLAGARAAKGAGYAVDMPEEVPATPFEAGPPTPLEPHPKGRDFVDFDEDLQVKDIRNAIADGYRELELVKRYSTVGMGPSQGRHSALPTARIVAGQTGRTVAEIGITTARPPFGPERLGVLAGPAHTHHRYSPMHHQHRQVGAQMMPAGAWWRPAYYGDTARRDDAIAAEVDMVRQSVGMLDVSTLGKLLIRGTDAAAFVDRIYTMAHAKQPVGRVRYCLMLNEMGSVIDDGVAFRFSDDEFYVTATTAAVGRVFSEMALLNAQWRMEVDIQNVTGAFAAVNLTGPKARAVLDGLTSDIDFGRDGFGFLEGRTGHVAGCPVHAMRIGFTGELSFELHTPQSYGAALWSALEKAGKALRLHPYGVEASRILRLEKGHIIIGQDTDALTTPHELGMEWALSKKKRYHLGRTSAMRRKELGLKRKLCGFQLPADPSAEIGESSLVLHAGEPVGFVTSIAVSPTLNKTIGLAYAHPDDSTPGSQIRLCGRCGTDIDAPVVSPHFFDPENTRQDI